MELQDFLCGSELRGSVIAISEGVELILVFAAQSDVSFVEHYFFHFFNTELPNGAPLSGLVGRFLSVHAGYYLRSIAIWLLNSFLFGNLDALTNQTFFTRSQLRIGRTWLSGNLLAAIFVNVSWQNQLILLP